MSNNNWLERDPSQSPGLRRIQEAQQFAALAKTQEAQRVREAGVTVREAGQNRLEMLARIEQKTAQVLPVLEEIRDFANATKTYPLGSKGSVDNPLELVSPAKIGVSEMFPSGADIKLVYGFKGSQTSSTLVCDDWVDRDYKSVEKYGINVRVVTDNIRDEILVLTQRIKVEVLPATPGGTFCKVYHPPKPEQKVKRKVNEWIEIKNSFDKESVRHFLGEAFHDPVYLGAKPLPLSQEVASQSEPQAGTGITGLVKGFLGLK